MSSYPPPLAGLFVLDLTSYLPGPYASQLLADLGADVLAVEPPGGEPGRSLPDRIRDDSALHWWVGRHKRSREIDLKSAEGAHDFARLVADADIVIEGFTPGVAQRLGVDYEACSRINPSVVYCSISGFGQDTAEARLPGHDLNFAARSGLLSQARSIDGHPATIGAPVVDIAASLHGVVAILAALRERDRTQLGQFIDISLLASALVLTAPQLMKVFAGEVPSTRSDINLGADPAYRAYGTHDGRQIVVGAAEQHLWSRLCAVLGREDLVPLRTSDPRRAIEELTELFGARDLAHWNGLLLGAGVCYSPVASLQEVLLDSTLREAGLFVDVDHPSGIGPTLLGPIRMSRTPPRLTRPAQPFRGDDT